MKDIGEGDDNDDNAKNDKDGKQNAAKTDQNINPHHMRIEDMITLRCCQNQILTENI